MDSAGWIAVIGIGAGLGSSVLLMLIQTMLGRNHNKTDKFDDMFADFRKEIHELAKQVAILTEFIKQQDELRKDINGVGGKVRDLEGHFMLMQDQIQSLRTHKHWSNGRFSVIRNTLEKQGINTDNETWNPPKE